MQKVLSDANRRIEQAIPRLPGHKSRTKKLPIEKQRTPEGNLAAAFLDSADRMEWLLARNKGTDFELMVSNYDKAVKMSRKTGSGQTAPTGMRGAINGVSSTQYASPKRKITDHQRQCVSAAILLIRANYNKGPAALKSLLSTVASLMRAAATGDNPKRLNPKAKTVFDKAG